MKFGIPICGSALVLLVGAAAFDSVPASAGDWPRFRGPNGSGVSSDAAPAPVNWSPEENIKWKVPLAGAGVSSPIVVGDKVFVTSYSGYGLDRRNPGDPSDLKRHLQCLDRATGKVLWDKSVQAVLPEDPYSGAGVPEHGYASHTPVSDGKRVFAFFGKSGVHAYDLDGEEIWHTNVGKGSDPRRWGSSSSPILYENTVIVAAGPESGAIVGLDAATGKELWRAEGGSLGNTWGTPITVPIDDERTDVVIGTPDEIWGLNPANGKLKWYCAAIPTDQFNSSVVANDGVVYAIEGRGGGSIAVRAGGKDDISKTNVLWNGRDSSRFGTPVIYEGRIYFFNGGVANCIDAKTGEKIFQARMRGGPASGTGPMAGGGADGNGPGNGPPGGGPGGRGPAGGGPGGGGFGGRPGRGGGGGGGFGGSDYSSAVAADGKIYYTTRNGETHVLKAGTKFEELAVNRVTEEAEQFSASPAISNGELFLRSNKHLYCIEPKK
jgi:outer membrane protein assembly factor BamB